MESFQKKILCVATLIFSIYAVILGIRWYKKSKIQAQNLPNPILKPKFSIPSQVEPSSIKPNILENRAQIDPSTLKPNILENRLKPVLEVISSFCSTKDREALLETSKISKKAMEEQAARNTKFYSDYKKKIIANLDPEIFSKEILKINDYDLKARFKAGLDEEERIYKMNHDIFKILNFKKFTSIANFAVAVIDGQQIKLLQNKEILSIVVRECGYYLKYASGALKNDKDVVLAAVKKNGFALKFASEELKDNPEIAFAAVKQNAAAASFASNRLKFEEEADSSIYDFAIKQIPIQFPTKPINGTNPMKTLFKLENKEVDEKGNFIT